MTTLTITSKGQITLGREVLEHLSAKPGSQVSVDMLPNGKIEIRARPTGDISAVFGLLKANDGPSFSIEEIDEAIKQAWAGKSKPVLGFQTRNSDLNAPNRNSDRH